MFNLAAPRTCSGSLRARSNSGWKPLPQLLHSHQQVRFHHLRRFPEQRLDLLEEGIVFCVGNMGLEVCVSVPTFHGRKLAWVFAIPDEIEKETPLLSAAISGVLSENGCEVIGVVKFKFGNEVELL